MLTLSRLRIAALGAWGVALCLLLPAPCQANIGPRWWGTPAGEPEGLKEVRIAHEELTIDLRPLAALQPASVKVVYHLVNSGAAKELHLVFISGAAEVQDFEVRLGDRPVASRPLPRQGAEVRKRFPTEWKVPEHLPGIDHEATYYLPRGEMTPLAFTVELPAGASTLRVRYRARASGADEGYPTATWQFPYVLSPAREWGDFGGLDVTVHLPAGWQSASTPALEREGSVLRGSFTGLPGDVLAVVTRAPVGPELRWAVYGSVALYLLAVVGGGLLCWGAGRALGRLQRRSVDAGGRPPFDLRTPLLAIPLGLLWPGLIFGAASLAVRVIRAPLAGQESPFFHEQFFGGACLTGALMLLALPLGAWLTWGPVPR